MYKAIVGERTFEVNLDKDKIFLDLAEFDFDMIPLSQNQYHIISNNKSYRAEVVLIDKVTKEVEIKVNNSNYRVAIKDKMDDLLEKLGMDVFVETKTDKLIAPMPGLILEIAVKKGDQVKKGDKLLILEAMKMENVIKSISDGIVNEVKMEVGASVENGQILITFE